MFKFQQQKNDKDGNALYMVEIPASLTAHAQVMSVDEFGKKQKVYGPGSYTGITSTYPGTDGTTGALSLTGSNTFEEGTNHNYWDIQTRNQDAGNYSDGMYKVFITVDKKQASHLSGSLSILVTRVWLSLLAMLRMRQPCHYTIHTRKALSSLVINSLLLSISLLDIHITLYPIT